MGLDFLRLASESDSEVSESLVDDPEPELEPEDDDGLELGERRERFFLDLDLCRREFDNDDDEMRRRFSGAVLDVLLVRPGLAEMDFLRLLFGLSKGERDGKGGDDGGG